MAICLATSMLLWLVFAMQDTYTMLYDLPMEVMNLPPGEALSERPPSDVRVQLRGQGSQLLTLRMRRPVVEVDASRESVALDEVELPVPRSVSYAVISPRSITLRREPRITRTLPIASHVVLQLPATHGLLYPPRLTPDSVTVSGARSIVEPLRVWPTTARTFTNVTDSLDALILLSDTLRGLVRLDTTVVRLSAKALAFTEEVREVPVRVTGAPGSLNLVTLEPASVRVRYRVVYDQYDAALNSGDFYAYVPYETLRSDTTGRVQPYVRVPEGLVLRDVEVLTPPLRYYNVVGE